MGENQKERNHLGEEDRMNNIKMNLGEIGWGGME
jgi:hypothetical protein